MGTVLLAAAEDTLAPQELLELCGASVVSSIRSARLVVGSGTSPNTRSNRRNALVTYVSSLIHHSQHHPKHHFHSTRMFGSRSTMSCSSLNVIPSRQHISS